MYSQVISDEPDNIEFQLYCKFCDLGFENDEKAQTLFDYFIVAKELHSGIADVDVNTNAHIAPHRPVQFKFYEKLVNTKKLTLRQPPKIGLVLDTLSPDSSGWAVVGPLGKEVSMVLHLPFCGEFLSAISPDSVWAGK